MAFFGHIIVDIYHGHWYEFDDGEEVTEEIPGGSNLQVGDTVEWDTGSYCGTARIVAIPDEPDVYFRIVKVP